MPNNSLLQSCLPVTSFSGQKVTCSSQAQRYLTPVLTSLSAQCSHLLTSILLHWSFFWVSDVWIVNGTNRISERHSSGIAVWAKVIHAFQPLKKPKPTSTLNSKQLKQDFNRHLQSKWKREHQTACVDEREEYRDIIRCYRTRWCFHFR